MLAQFNRKSKVSIGYDRPYHQFGFKPVKSVNGRQSKTWVQVPAGPVSVIMRFRFCGADDLKWTYCEVLSGETILIISCVQITFNIVLMIIKKWLAILKEKNEV